MRRRINPKEGASIVAVGGRERRNRNVGRHVGVMTLYAIYEPCVCGWEDLVRSSKNFIVVVNTENQTIHMEKSDVGGRRREERVECFFSVGEPNKPTNRNRWVECCPLHDKGDSFKHIVGSDGT